MFPDDFFYRSPKSGGHARFREANQGECYYWRGLRTLSAQPLPQIGSEVGSLLQGVSLIREAPTPPLLFLPLHRLVAVLFVESQAIISQLLSSPFDRLEDGGSGFELGGEGRLGSGRTAAQEA